jgi:signal transduction histidine kinase
LYLDRITALCTGMGALPQGATVPAQLLPLPSRQVSRPRCASLAWWLTPAGAFCWMTTPGFAFGLASASVALAVATTVIAIADGDLFIIVALVPGALGAATMGGLVAVRRPGHPMGLLLGAIALTAALCDLTVAYGRAAILHFPGSLPGGQPVMWLNSWDFVPAECFTVLVLPLVFPEGRLPSPRWRPAGWAVAAFFLLSVAGNAFAPISMGRWYDDRPNPYAVSGPLFLVILDASYAFGLVAILAAVGSVVLRWRRADHMVRQQLKWFLAAVPFLMASGIAGQFFYNVQVLDMILAAMGGTFTAVAIGLAVLRYKLYEIDVLLSRAVVYGLLSAAVAGLSPGVLAIAGIVFGAGDGVDLQILATLTAAAVLLPVRGRLQRQVDRLLFGDRGAPYVAMARLGRQVEQATPAEPVLGSVASVVAGSLRLLANLATQVAPAAHVVALREALDASRAGLAGAREEERRRLRRDLHDGLGPTIAGLTLGLDTALAVPGGSDDLRGLLESLKAESQRAADDVRRIVRGLRPPALDELGLGGALHAEVARVGREAPGLSVILDVPGSLVDDVPAAVEVAAYRIVTEALTNVLRHAGARCCKIRINVGAGLRLEVSDDGAGMPEGWRAGVGITAMRERVAELDGELEIGPAVPRGTRVTARLPMDGIR